MHPVLIIAGVVWVTAIPAMLLVLSCCYMRPVRHH